jgi:hypothetical protein
MPDRRSACDSFSASDRVSIPLRRSLPERLSSICWSPSLIAAAPLAQLLEADRGKGDVNKPANRWGWKFGKGGLGRALRSPTRTSYTEFYGSSHVANCHGVRISVTCELCHHKACALIRRPGLSSQYIRLMSVSRMQTRTEQFLTPSTPKLRPLPQTEATCGRHSSRLSTHGLGCRSALRSSLALNAQALNFHRKSDST